MRMLWTREEAASRIPTASITTAFVQHGLCNSCNLISSDNNSISSHRYLHEHGSRVSACSMRFQCVLRISIILRCTLCVLVTICA
jgi:hypothetical protein